MKTALVVLGMHRSGTSSVAGALTLLGAAAPLTLMPAAADNPRGFWESNVVMSVDDTLLAEAGSSWNDWRRLSLPSTPDSRIADALRGEFGDEEMIVLKDPRICRLFPTWRSTLAQAGYRILIISPLRPPSEVAASLQARSPISREQGLRLWLRHVLEAEATSRGLPRHFMLWSSFLADWRAELALINSRLNIALAPITADGAAVDDFLTTDLHRQRDATWTGALVSQTWTVLCDLARHGDHADLHARLDALTEAFNQAGILFADAP